MALKAVVTFGLCIFLFVYAVATTSTNDCKGKQVTNPCIVNVTNPNCTKCVDGSYASVPDDPTMFYHCSNGEYYPIHCEPDTLWNETVCTCIKGEVTTTVSYDSKTVISTVNTTIISTMPSHTTPKPIISGFDAASFGGGIGAGFGISLIFLILIRCCCSSSERNGYDQHI